MVANCEVLDAMAMPFERSFEPTSCGTIAGIAGREKVKAMPNRAISA